MSIRIRAILSVCIIILLFAAFFIYAQVQERTHDLQKNISFVEQNTQTAFKYVRSEIERNHQIVASELFMSPDLIEAFALRDRKKVAAISRGYFENHKKGLKIGLIAFIQNDNVHFFRAHDPSRFGDNVSARREIIDFMNKTPRLMSSVEATLYGGNYLSLFPVYYKGKYVGFIQIGTSMNHFYDQLTKEHNVKSALFFDNSVLVKMGIQMNGVKIGSFVGLAQNSPLFSKLPSSFNFKPSDEFSDMASTYVLQSFPFKDYQNRIIAWFVIANDVTVIQKYHHQMMIKFILLTGSLILAISLVMYFAYAYFSKILSDNENKLRHQLHYDLLTDLPNRITLEQKLSKHPYVMLVIFNIDSFKTVNDFYGVKAGDMVLKKIGEYLKESIFHYGLSNDVYRISGDEFAVIFERDFQQWAERSRDIIAGATHYTIFHDDQEIYVSLSCGAAIADKNVIEKADMALKEAKTRQKAFLMYDPDMELLHQYATNLKWSKKVKEAISFDNFVPYFQPIVNTHTGMIDKYEALVRLKDLDGTVISPFHFLDVAKKAKLYPFITEAMIEKTFNIFKDIPLGVSLNLSVDDILDHEMEALILKNLKKIPNPERIVFEILESEGIENFGEVAHFIREVKKLGAQIAIDDFGSGYSNFAYILRLNVDYIKIDASLIKNIDKDENAQIVCTTIIEFAKKLGLKTTAEYVHSKEVYDKCLELGFDFLQGYYLGEPTELSAA